MTQLRQFAFKKFGYADFHHDLSSQLEMLNIKDFIKIVFIKADGHVIIDFQEYHLKQDAFFFINAGQYYWFDDNCIGTILYYNRDFYCVEIHDKEVACDGILFHNVYEIPLVLMNADVSGNMKIVLNEIKTEMVTQDTGTEEMLRILLKQIIIKCTRIWKQDHRMDGEEARPELEFSRTFSQLVEWHYTHHHTVAEFAALLHISPKALNKRITRNTRTTPNDIIKNRIILEAKRLLAHTQLTIKEIGYKLGYEDTSYFIRFFTKQVTTPPQSFRLKYQQDKGFAI